MKKLIAIGLAMAMLAFTACSGPVKSSEKLNVTSDEIQFSPPVSGDTVANIKTDKGVIKVKLFPKVAPKAVENFVKHSKDGYYNGLTFHRVLKDFIIQSGSPDGTPGAGESIWGVEFEDEFSDILHNYTGALAMANHGADTNSSQFYFVTAPVGGLGEDILTKLKEADRRDAVIDGYKQAGGAPTLDYAYTVFGQIYEGLDVAFDISKVSTNEEGKPKKDVKIQTIEISVIE
ncbi:MAG: peptidylprolyl isomerase [Oscillospiraceae bacterium]